MVNSTLPSKLLVLSFYIYIARSPGLLKSNDFFRNKQVSFFFLTRNSSRTEKTYRYCRSFALLRGFNWTLTFWSRIKNIFSVCQATDKAFKRCQNYCLRKTRGIIQRQRKQLTISERILNIVSECNSPNFVVHDLPSNFSRSSPINSTQFL